MKRLSFIAILVLSSGMMTGIASTRALADQECIDSCMQRNYATQFCNEKCSGGNPLMKQPSDRRLEPLCYSDCKSTGHDDGYCNKSCIY